MKFPQFAIGFTAVALTAFVPGCAEQPVSTTAPDRVTGWVAIDMTPGPVVPPFLGQLPDSLKDFHFAANHEFVSIQDHFGAGRMPIMRSRHGYVPNPQEWAKKAKYHFQELDDRVGATVQWELTNLQLMGLMKHPEGAVYQIPMTAKANMENLKNFPTRGIDDFESEALAKLKDGQNAVAFVEHNRVRMLGAIRLTGDCRQCHQQPDGTLMGAFTYDFVRDPEPYKPVAKANATPVPQP